MKSLLGKVVCVLLVATFVQVAPKLVAAAEVTSASQMPGTNNYYLYVGNSVSWQTAYDSAKSMTFQGAIGHLANVTSAEENNFLRGLGNRGWLGAKRDSAQTFRWMDGPEAGQPLTFTSWAPGEPNNCCGGEPYIESASGSWNDNGGMGETFGYYVEFEPNLNPTEITSASQMPGTDHFYAYLPYSLSWEKAKEFAEKSTYKGMSGHLATVTSAEENSFIASLGGRGWLGAKRDEASAFRWFSGPESGAVLTYTSWYSGEPNCPSCEFYLETNFGGTGLWNDVNGERGFFIEFEPDQDPINMPGTDHYYLYVPGGYSWDVANNLAAKKTWQGLSGHLVTITSREENEFVKSLSPNREFWLGGGLKSDSGNSFQWLVGPDAGNVITNCVQGNQSCINTSLYNNWDLSYPNSKQPEAAGENKLAISRTATGEFGSWHDWTGSSSLAFVVEFEIGALIRPGISGAAVTGRSITGSVGSYLSGTTVSSFSWQKSIDGNTWETVPVSSPALADSASKLSYKLSAQEENIQLRLAVLVANGNSTATFYSDIVTVRKSVLSIQQKSTLGYDTLCVIQKTTNKLKCQGQKVPNWDDEFQSVDASVNALCAATVSGKVKCLAYGSNYFSQDGLVDSDGFVTGVSEAVSISNGWAYSCALILDGTVSCWGYGYWGVFGPDNFGVSALPVKVPGLSKIVQLESAWDHVCALNQDGEVLCWGRNNFGQLGLGYSNNLVATPTKVAGLGKVTSISAERYHTCATTSDGKVWCWGDSWWGEAGNGLVATSVYSPVQAGSISDAKQVYSGSDYNCALTTEDRVYCWGANNVSQSNPATANQEKLAFPSLLSIRNVGSLLLGHGQSCAVLKTGEVSCWGSNQFGQQRIPDANYLYEQNKNSFAPASPTIKTVSIAAENLKINFDELVNFSGVSYHARIVDGSNKCSANLQSLCVLEGLTNYQSYSIEVRASSESGSSSWVKLPRLYTPRPPGLKMIMDSNNLRVNEMTRVRIFDAPANSTVWLKVGSNPRFAISADEDGFATTQIWANKASKVSVMAITKKAMVRDVLYSPKLVQFSTIQKLGKSAKVLVQYVTPGSQVVINLSDGRKLSITAGTSANTTVLIPLNSRGILSWTVTVDGKELGVGVASVF